MVNIVKAMTDVRNFKTLKELSDHYWKRFKDAEKEYESLDLNHEDSQWYEGLKDGYEGAYMILEFFLENKGDLKTRDLSV